MSEVDLIDFSQAKQVENTQTRIESDFLHRFMWFEPFQYLLLKLVIFYTEIVIRKVNLWAF